MAGRTKGMPHIVVSKPISAAWVTSSTFITTSTFILPEGLGYTKDLGQILSYREDESVARSRRKFSPQFKAEAVQFVILTGRPVVEVANELDIHERTVGN